MVEICTDVLILMNEKLRIGKGGQNTELTARSPLRGRRSALERSVIEEEEAVLKKNLKPLGIKRRADW
jgi:hypothetical protein